MNCKVIDSQCYVKNKLTFDPLNFVTTGMKTEEIQQQEHKFVYRLHGGASIYKFEARIGPNDEKTGWI